MPTWLTRLCWGASPRRTLLRAVIWAVLVYALAQGPFRPMRVRGISMEPTIHDGSWRFANLWRYRRQSPKRGEVVVIAMPGAKAFYCKRVIGLPGEQIAFVQGHLLVNGFNQPEPYLTEAFDWNVAPVDLGADEFYVVGDNRTLPLSAQVAGIVDRKRISGGLWQ